MAAAWVIFQNELETTFKLNQVQDFSDFAEKFSSAFSRSTLNLATTSTGQFLTYGNYNLIKNSIKMFLDFNRDIETNLEKIKISLAQLDSFVKSFNSNEPSEIQLPSDLHPFVKKIISPKIKDINKKILDLSKSSNENIAEVRKSISELKDYVNNINLSMIPYLFLETAFISFWLTAQFSPAPPAPPTVSPLFGITVLTPGIPGILSAAFKLGFTSKDPSIAAKFIVNGIKTQALTVSGVYSGLIPSPTGLVPSPPIPWIGVI